VATLGDAEERLLPAEHAPQRAPLSSGAPAGLLDVERRGLPELVVQVRVGFLQGCAGAADDHIDGAGRERRAKQLAQELCGIAPRDAVAHREAGDRRLQARAEGSGRHPGRQLGPRLGGTSGAAQPLQAVLAHPHGDRGQLADLMALRRGDLDALLLLKRSRA